MIKNITLNAEEELIRKARMKAQKEKSSLNAKFRQWLKSYTNSKESSYDDIMADFGHIDAGRSFSREELNER